MALQGMHMRLLRIIMVIEGRRKNQTRQKSERLSIFGKSEYKSSKRVNIPCRLGEYKN